MRMAKTLAAWANDVSMSKELSLSNGEFAALMDMMEGSPEPMARRLMRLSGKAIMEEIRTFRGDAVSSGVFWALPPVEKKVSDM